VLVRTKGFGTSKRSAWLLIKHKDKYASPQDITVKSRSAVSKRSMAGIATAFGGDVAKAAESDPK
jgi:bifunctional non-homologous end joining protein LigD